MKSRSYIHCRIKPFTIEKRNLLTKPNILKLINMTNYVIKVILLSVYNSFNIQAIVDCFFTMNPCVCMKLIPVNKVHISWSSLWIRSPTQRLQFWVGYSILIIMNLCDSDGIILGLIIPYHRIKAFMAIDTLT